MMGKNIVLALLTSLLFVSCDGFFLGPAMNLNHDDPNRAFGRLECEPIDSDEIRVIWDWYDIERALRGISPVYDEIIIKHNTGSYPTSRLGGESYLLTSWDASTNPMSSTIFTDLKRDRDHYFALYAHEAGGSWMAPVYASTFLDANQSPWSSTFFVTDAGNTAAGDMGSSGSFDTIDVTSLPQNQTLSENLFNIFYYDLGGEDKISFAELNFNVSAAPAAEVTLIIHPMRVRWNSGDPPNLAIGGTDQFMVDRSIQAEHTFSVTDSGNFSVNITELFAKSQYHRTYGVFMHTDGGQLGLEYPNGSPVLDAQIMENW